MKEKPNSDNTKTAIGSSEVDQRIEKYKKVLGDYIPVVQKAIDQSTQQTEKTDEN